MAARPPFHEAIFRGDVELVRIYISAGHDVNEFSDAGESPIDLAIRRGNRLIVELLVNSGANVNLRNLDSETPLHLAVKQNNLDFVKILIEAGANVDEKDDLGDASLHFFFCDELVRNVEILRCLILAGADPAVRDRHGNTPLHIAYRGGDFIPFEILEKASKRLGLQINIKNKLGETVLNRMVTSSNVHNVKLFIDAGADVNTRNINGQCLLHTAAVTITDNENMIKFLMSEGLNINDRDNLGRTPLHWATEKLKGNTLLRKVELLLKNGALVNEKNNLNQSPLQSFLNMNPPKDETLEEKGVNLQIFELFTEQLIRENNKKKLEANILNL